MTRNFRNFVAFLLGAAISGFVLMASATDWERCDFSGGRMVCKPVVRR